MFTYHFYINSIEMYFKVGYWVVYCDVDDAVDIFDEFYNTESLYGIGDKEYFCV